MIDPGKSGRLETLLARRVDAVVQRLIDTRVSGWFFRRILSNAWWLKKGDVLKRATDLIHQELSERGQLET